MLREISPLLQCLKPLEECSRDCQHLAPGRSPIPCGCLSPVHDAASYGYFAFFHADPLHPDWAPLWNPASTLQPNPDDIYLFCPISSEYSYRFSGNSGTVYTMNLAT